MEIIEVPIEEEVKQSYIDYAMSVIVGRAIPDVRDGLKPVQRRILYSMYEMGLTPDKPFKKSARIVGECFVKGTKVATAKGIKNIEDVKEGELVYTSRGLRRVTQLFIMPPQPLKEVITELGLSVRCTPRQKFKVLTEEGELTWKEAKELKSGDVLLLRGMFPDVEEDIFVVEDIKIDSELAYLLGLFVGGGRIEKDKRGYHRLGIFVSDTRIRERIEKVLTTKGFNFSKLKDGTIRLNSTDTKLFMKILDADSTLNAESKKLPEWLFRASKDVALSFVCGVIDSDGSVHRSRNVVNISSVSYSLIKELQVLLFYLGIPAKLYSQRAKSPTLYGLEISGHYIYKLFTGPVRPVKALRSDVGEPTKRVKADRIPHLGRLLLEEFSRKHVGGGWYVGAEGKKAGCGIKYQTGTKIRYSSKLKELNVLKKEELVGSRHAKFLKEVLDNNWFFLKVEEVKDLPSEETYDIQVEEEHEFLANGFVVHNCLGKFHPHGDQAVYDALVRMAQDFSMRYPLIIGQGNYGSVDGDPPAQMRYTEAKLSRIALEMLEDIDKDTVDFVPNFDESLTEPTVLPSKFPNLLCNGTAGIAVGLATSIPPHNLREIGKALIELAKNPNITTEELLEIVKGPDFPTGGIIENLKDLKEIYETGRGIVQVKAKAHVEKVQGGKEQIVISELPYQVNKAELIKKIADNVRNGRIKEISDIRDESDKEGIRIVIELKREAKGEKVLKKLYKHTQLKKGFPVNLVVLVNGEPKLVGLKDLLREFIRHRLNVILRRTKFFLKKAEDRLHVVQGLLIALNNLDEVIEGIRKSKDVPEARSLLQARFGLTERQAQAVLDLRLHRLTSLEREKLRQEEAELLQKIEYYRKVIGSEEERIKVFVEETEYLVKRYGDPRRTFIEGLEEKLEEGSLVVAVLENGKVMPVEDMPEGESPVVDILDVPFTEGLFLVSNRGRVYWLAGSQALRGSRVHFKESGERIVGAFIRERFADRLLLATRNGFIKKIPLVEFEYKAQGMRIIKLSEDDEVVGIAQSIDMSDVLMFTRRGKVARFNVREIPPATPGTKGAQGIKVEEGDEVAGIRVLRDEPFLVVVTPDGKVKRIYQEEIPVRNRGVKGVNVLGSARERLLDLLPIGDTLEVLVTTKLGKAFYEKLRSGEIHLTKRDRLAKPRWELEEEDEIRRIVIKSEVRDHEEGESADNT